MPLSINFPLSLGILRVKHMGRILIDSCPPAPEWAGGCVGGTLLSVPTVAPDSFKCW